MGKTHNYQNKIFLQLGTGFACPCTFLPSFLYFPPHQKKVISKTSWNVAYSQQTHENTISHWSRFCYLLDMPYLFPFSIHSLIPLSDPLQPANLKYNPIFTGRKLFLINMYIVFSQNWSSSSSVSISPLSCASPHIREKLYTSLYRCIFTKDT